MATITQDTRRLDASRRMIGTALLVLLVVMVLLGFGVLFFIEADGNRAMVASVHSAADVERLAAAARIAADQSKADADRLALLLNIVFGPVVTLLGSVVGFYFGSQAKRRE
jgi:succinate dehydrogenase hydrophobic anchor subunit